MKVDDCAKISPCPYCGETDMHIHRTNKAFGDDISDMYHVTCCGCASFGPLRRNMHEAIKLWNDVADLWHSEHMASAYKLNEFKD